MTTKWEVNRAVRASNLPAPSRLIMLTLSDIAVAGTAEIPPKHTPSLTVLARETGLGRSTVAEHLALLEEGGWIVRTRPDVAAARLRGERTCYRLAVPADAPKVQETDYLVQEPDGGSPGAGPDLVQEPDQPSPGAGHRKNDLNDPNNQDLSSSATQPKAKRKAKPEPERADVMRLCNHLADRIGAHEGVRRPTIGQKWLVAARMLIDTDKISEERIHKAIDWAHEHHFWHTNILSMTTLRKQYDQLQLQAMAETKAKNAPRSKNGRDSSVASEDRPGLVPFSPDDD